MSDLLKLLEVTISKRVKQTNRQTNKKPRKTKQTQKHHTIKTIENEDELPQH